MRRPGPWFLAVLISTGALALIGWVLEEAGISERPVAATAATGAAAVDFPLLPLEGEVFQQRAGAADEPWVPLAGVRRAVPGARLRTGAGTTLLYFPRWHCKVHLDPFSTLVFDEVQAVAGDHRVTLRLEGGALQARLPQLTGANEFVVVLPRCRLHIVGTTFAAGTDEAEDRVYVLAGRVRLDVPNLQQKIVLKQGESLTVAWSADDLAALAAGDRSILEALERRVRQEALAAEVRKDVERKLEQQDDAKTVAKETTALAKFEQAAPATRSVRDELLRLRDVLLRDGADAARAELGDAFTMMEGGPMADLRAAEAKGLKIVPLGVVLDSMNISMNGEQTEARVTLSAIASAWDDTRQKLLSRRVAALVTLQWTGERWQVTSALTQ